MATTEVFDDIVLGGGKGGKSLAMALGPAGHKTALIERGQIGGTCINVACIPTKTMVTSAKLFAKASHADALGITLQKPSESIRGIIERKRRVVKSMVDTHWEFFRSTPNMEFILGEGKFVGEKQIEVTEESGNKRILTAQRIYINTGSRTTIPQIAGLDSVPYLTSTSIMELDELPKHLAIVGGGYISLEFAQVFRRLGSEVTVLLRGNRFLPREDEDIAAVLKEILEAEGVVFKSDVAISSVEKTDSGVRVNLDLNLNPNPNKDKGSSQSLECSHLMLAIGRNPNTKSLQLEKTGVEVDKNGAVKVNNKLETNVPGIWAIGDCNGGPLFTHVSWDDFRILRDNVLHDAKRSIDARLVPYTLFTDPELGRVGITEDEARKQGLDILVAKIPAKKVPRANTNGETRGILKAVVDKQTKQILGCSLVCDSAGEVMSVVQVAMLGKLPYTAVRDTIFTHPTMAESLNLLFATI